MTGPKVTLGLLRPAQHFFPTPCISLLLSCIHRIGNHHEAGTSRSRKSDRMTPPPPKPTYSSSLETSSSSTSMTLLHTRAPLPRLALADPLLLQKPIAQFSLISPRHEPRTMLLLLACASRRPFKCGARARKMWFCVSWSSGGGDATMHKDFFPISGDIGNGAQWKSDFYARSMQRL